MARNRRERRPGQGASPNPAATTTTIVQGSRAVGVIDDSRARAQSVERVVADVAGRDEQADRGLLREVAGLAGRVAVDLARRGRDLGVEEAVR
jgi:hypothetical protein